MKKKNNSKEQQMFVFFLGLLQPFYKLVHVSDYNDVVPPELLSRCIKDGSLEALYEGNYYLEARLSAAQYEIDELLESAVREGRYTADEIREFKCDSRYIELIETVQDRDESTPEKDAFRQSQIQARVMLHSNYDCWLPLYETGALYLKDSALQGMLTMLSLNPRKVKEEAIRQGVPVEGRWPDYKYREGREVVRYKEFVEVLRECPNYGLWTFFGCFDMKALSEKVYDLDSLVIPEGTVCTLFNDWNGGGSCVKARTVRSISLRELNRKGATQHDCARVYIDEKFRDNRGYCSAEVYGEYLSFDKILTAA